MSVVETQLQQFFPARPAWPRLFARLPVSRAQDDSPTNQPLSGNLQSVINDLRLADAERQCSHRMRSTERVALGLLENRLPDRNSSGRRRLRRVFGRVADNQENPSYLHTWENPVCVEIRNASTRGDLAR